MSDEPPIQLESLLIWKLGVESPSLRYAARAVSNPVLFAVRIPYLLLKAWHELYMTSGSNVDNNQYTYTDFLEYSVPDNSFGISPDKVIRSRINAALASLSSRVIREYHITKGRKRMDLDSKSKLLHIFKGETVSIKDIRKENCQVKDELEKWKKTCVGLETNIRELYQEMQTAIAEKDEEISTLNSVNEDFKTYIDKLERSQNLVNLGKDISDVKKKSRTLKTFISWAEIALWFARSFGLEINSMKVSEIKTGLQHTLHINDSHDFDTISDNDKSKIEMVLFLLDKFCIGDNFYHEMTMLFDDLPRSYLVKQKRTQLNEMCHITSTPGDEEGTQVSFEELLRERIKDYVTTHPTFARDEAIKVKISGDGARMTRISNFILMSFALVESDCNAMAANGNHTIGVVKGKEDYETLKTCFRDVFADINKLVEEKKILVDGKLVNLDFFLGGDYKFLLMLMGLSGATSNHACLWCKVHKDDRWNMSYNLQYFNSPEMKRNLKDLRESAEKKSGNYCCVNPPLLNIELDHIIPDELHLLLRIMDVLIGNLVTDAVEWDRSDNWNKNKSEQKNTHVTELVETIRGCGISFDIWEKTNADRKGSGTYDFTSLMGADKKKLLDKLPDKFEGVIRPATCATVTEIWRKFAVLYGIVTCIEPSKEIISDYHDKAREWIELFISLRDKMSGYKRARVTPYMHVMAYHIPKFLMLYSTVKAFTGQGVERNNDVARKIVLQKSSKHDSTGDVLKLESRQWELKSHERSKRVYEKKNLHYWDCKVFEDRKNKRRKPQT